MKTWLNENDIRENQTWHASDGSGHTVTILRAENGWVHYSWIERGSYKRGELRTHKKTVFAFQVRYYLPEA